MTYHNIQGELRLAHTSRAHEQLFASLLTEPEHVFASVFAEPASGYGEADRYARRLAGEAEDWLAFARERSRMKDDTLVSKALSSLAFTLQHRAHSLVIPSKLVGTSKHQRTLWNLVRARTPFGTELSVEEADGKLLVSLDGQPLGAVQSKHVPWLRPLIPFGARVFLVRVTGHEHEGYRLGVNVAFGRAGAAVTALGHALGQDIGGDGYGGDGAAVGLPEATSKPSDSRSAGNGVAPKDQARSCDPENADPNDVLLWRDERGIAQVSRRQGELVHVVRHSPTGPEWGYCGSGPADLAYSVLIAFTDEATARRHYQAFKAEVVATIPMEGGVIPSRTVRGWLARRTEAARRTDA